MVGGGERGKYLTGRSVTRQTQASPTLGPDRRQQKGEGCQEELRVVKKGCHRQGRVHNEAIEQEQSRQMRLKFGGSLRGRR